MQANAPTQQDLDYSVDCIKNVLAKLDELQVKYPAKKYEASFKYARLQMQIGMDLHTQFIPAFNDRKRLLDAAMRAEDVAAFEEHYNEISNMLYRFGLSEKLTIAKKKVAYYFNVSKPYQNKLIRGLDWLVDVRDGGKEELKRMKMTPAERAASDKRSEAMRMRWGMC